MDTPAPLLTWEIIPQCMATDLAADTLINKIKAYYGDSWDSANDNVLSELGAMLTCTEHVEVNSTTAKAVLGLFASMVNHWQSQTPDTLWNWRVHLPYKLLIRWREEWLAGQALFEADPATLPTSELTPEQREELKHKNSPLA